MIIPIDEDYRLAADARCWMIEKRKPRKDVDAWEPIRWHTTPEAAVKGLAGLMIRTSEAETLTEALRAVERVTSRLSLALHPPFEVKGGPGIPGEDL